MAIFIERACSCIKSQKHIFPGGFLPSLTVLGQVMTRHTRFIVDHLENIGHHYARTLKEWRLKFMDQINTASRMGFDPPFIRKWEYYLACCEAGFEKRAPGDIQVILARASETG